MNNRTINDAELIVDGEKALKVILDCIKEAEKTISIRMYMWRDDECGRMILDALKKKIKDNPDMRILIEKDAFGTRVYNFQKYMSFGRMGGDIFFSPAGQEFIKNEQVIFRYIGTPSILLFKYNKENNHSKVYIFDEGTPKSKIMIGGMNIANEYLIAQNRKDPDKGGWHDYMVLIRGNISDDIYSHDFRKNHRFLSRKLREGMNIIMNIKSNQSKEILKEIDRAKKSIIIEHGYLTHPTIIRKLKRISRRGVKVRIIIPSESDGVYHANMHSIYRFLKPSLIKHKKKSDLEIYLYDGMIHAKVILIDDYTAIIGSANLTNGSFGYLKETNAIFRQNLGITKTLSNQLKKDMKISTRMTLKNIPKYNRLLAWIQSLFI